MDARSDADHSGPGSPDPSEPGPWARKLNELLGIDRRTLGVFRIGLATMILVDLWIRCGDLTAHYSDAGILPRTDAIRSLRSWSLCVHLMSGAPAIQALLLLVAGAFAVALLVGFRTRLVTCVSWFLLMSLHDRNPLILNSGDQLLRALLFWGMFLPLGACFSLDAALDSSKRTKPAVIVSVATIAVMIQMCILYWFAAVAKVGPEWRVDHTASYYALSTDQYTTPTGRLLLRYPELLKVLTRSVLWIEAYGPFLLFVPFFTARIRMVAIAAFMLMHAGFGTLMHIGLFSLVSIVGWGVFVPGQFWDAVSRWSNRRERLRPLATAISEHRRRIWSRLSPHLRRRPLRLEPSPVGNLACALALIYVFAANVQFVHPDRLRIPERIRRFGALTHMNQQWMMFAPGPITKDGWYVIVGTLADGEQIDVFRNGAPVSWDKPEDVSAMYENQRWRRVMMSLSFDHNSRYRRALCRYLLRDWNARHGADRRIDELDLYFMLEETLPDGLPPTPERRLLESYEEPAQQSGFEITTEWLLWQ